MRHLAGLSLQWMRTDALGHITPEPSHDSWNESQLKVAAYNTSGHEANVQCASSLRSLEVKKQDQLSSFSCLIGCLIARKVQA